MSGSPHGVIIDTDHLGREVKRARTSQDEGEQGLSSSVIDVDAIVDQVLRDDVEQFDLRSTPEHSSAQIKSSISSGDSHDEGPFEDDEETEGSHYQDFEEHEGEAEEGDGEETGSLYGDAHGSAQDESESELVLDHGQDGEQEQEQEQEQEREMDETSSLDYSDNPATDGETSSLDYSDNSATDDESSILRPAPEDILDRIMSLGPNLFVQQQMLTGQSPERLLGLLGYPLPAGLLYADFMAKWAYVKRFLIKYVYERPRLGLSSLQDIVELLARSRKIMIITGAGISVSCGIPDFRSENGLYAKIQEKYALPEPECMFDIEFFRIDAEPFYSFARELLPSDEFKPSFCHYFIADLEKRGQLLRQYTQNIDTLEEDAGIQSVVYCHGSFATASCLECRQQFGYEQFKDMTHKETVPTCPSCSGVIKPDIVFFGESLPKSFDDHIAVDCGEADLVLVIGSSMKVHPVSSLPDLIPPHVPQILINRESLDHNFDIELLGDCDMILAELFRQLGRSFSDANVAARFASLASKPVESRFLEPIYHIFPGAKAAPSLDEVPRPADASPISSEALVGDPDGGEMLSGGEAHVSILPDDPIAFQLLEPAGEEAHLPLHALDFWAAETDVSAETDVGAGMDGGAGMNVGAVMNVSVGMDVDLKGKHPINL